MSEFVKVWSNPFPPMSSKIPKNMFRLKNIEYRTSSNKTNKVIRPINRSFFSKEILNKCFLSSTSKTPPSIISDQDLRDHHYCNTIFTILATNSNVKKQNS